MGLLFRKRNRIRVLENVGILVYLIKILTILEIRQFL